MIKISKPVKPPQILIEKSEEWTNELVQTIKLYGSYKHIPSNEKEKILKNYKHNDIKEKLFKCSFFKCVFCECKPDEGGNIEVEHFAPKSIYYEKTFEWENLLPVCRKCNSSKSDYDTIQNEIINPSKVDPEDYFEYYLLSIVPKENSPCKDIATRTIDVCNLNSPRLLKPRSDILVQLTIYEKELKDKIIDFENSKIEKQKKSMVTKLNNSLEAIDILKEAKEKYSGFCKCFINNSKVYLKAKEIVSKYII